MAGGTNLLELHCAGARRILIDPPTAQAQYVFGEVKDIVATQRRPPGRHDAVAAVQDTGLDLLWLPTVQPLAITQIGKPGRTAGIGPQLVSEPGPWKPGTPKTIGSYWPYSTTVYDYIRRAMPFNAPGSLTNDQVYAVTAWLLAQNHVIDASQEMNAQTLPQVKMPNRDNFIQCWPNACRPDIGR